MSAVRVSVTMTETQFETLRHHLYPGDGKEAVAIALCGYRDGSLNHRLLVREVHPISHNRCYREKDSVQWPTDEIAPILEQAHDQHLSVLKFHSHPSGYDHFSQTDDESDANFFITARNWIDAPVVHGSVVMLPNYQMFGRAMLTEEDTSPIYSVGVVGDQLIYHFESPADKAPEFTKRHAQVFGAATTNKLRKLSVGVVGCSGTGSILIEQLARLGIGRLVLVDPDFVEEKNLNRIVNATRKDVENRTLKVHVAERAIRSMGLGTNVLAIPTELSNVNTVYHVAECDVVFGCMDSIDGRHLLNRLSVYYTLPYFDLGVRIDVQEGGEIEGVMGSVHYVQPGRSTLLSRGVVRAEEISGRARHKADPKQYQADVSRGYLRGVLEERPAVISVNTAVAALAVNEFLSRLHNFREENNSNFAVSTINMTWHQLIGESEGSQPACLAFSKYLGRGDTKLLLGMPELSEGTVE